MPTISWNPSSLSKEQWHEKYTKISALGLGSLDFSVYGLQTGKACVYSSCLDIPAKQNYLLLLGFRFQGCLTGSDLTNFILDLIEAVVSPPDKSVSDMGNALFFLVVFIYLFLFALLTQQLI